MGLYNKAIETTKWIKLNNRLARLKKGDIDKEYWKNHWKKDAKIKQLLNYVKNNDLHEYERIFKKYLSKDKLILEAGCGIGYVVEILRIRGYKVKGVDYEKEVIDFAKRQFPEASVETGDVFDLENFNDSSIYNYISLGVLEHFESGCDKALYEIFRTLERDGIALISVPNLNKARLSYLSSLKNEDLKQSSYRFYQYYFEVNDFSKLLKKNGLKVVAKYPLFTAHFLKNEHEKFIKYIWNFPMARYRLRPLWLLLISMLTKKMKMRYCHMVMYICKKDI